VTREPVPEAIEERLRAHVTAVIAAAGVAGSERDDLHEELLGHLSERWQARRDDGLDTAAAADLAIADFGSVAEIGGELGRTYHSRLWASTIGVVLPAVTAPAERPSAVVWLRFVLCLLLVLDTLAALVMLTLTPLHLLIMATAAVVSTAGILLAFKALGRAQRWALDYALWATVIVLVLGLFEVVAGAQSATTTIPLGSILAAVVLLIARGQWAELQRFVAGSSRPTGVLALAIVVSLLAPMTPRVLAAIPDPTQASAEDLELRIEMSCGRRDVTTAFGQVISDAQVATIVVDATWTQTDLLPLGFERFFSGPDDADTSAIRVNDFPTPWLWSDDDGPTIVDLATGDPVGVWGSTAQSNRLLPADVIGTMTIALERHEVHPDHTIRMTWELIYVGDGRAAWPSIDVYYAHLERFLVAGDVTCNGIRQGAVVDPASLQPADGALPELP
jgi:hypothetical protein